MSWRDIRPVALGAVRRENGEILVSKLYEPGEDEPFYRLIGGGVEFGEHSRESVVREFDEELDVELTNVGYTGTYEATWMAPDRLRNDVTFYAPVVLDDLG